MRWQAYGLVVVTSMTGCGGAGMDAKDAPEPTSNAPRDAGLNARRESATADSRDNRASRGAQTVPTDLLSEIKALDARATAEEVEAGRLWAEGERAEAQRKAASEDRERASEAYQACLKRFHGSSNDARCASEKVAMEDALNAESSARAAALGLQERAISARQAAKATRKQVNTHEAKKQLDESRKSSMECVADTFQDRMVDFRGGTYMRENPKETVAVKPFALDLTEVTVDAYTRCVNEGKCSAPGAADRLCNWGQRGKGCHPINCVDASQANSYCSWAGKRLPTESEWEWAARGQERGTTHPWGNEDPGSRACWNRRDEGTCPVGAFALGDSSEGVHDLGGNVWEWTWTELDAKTLETFGKGGAYDSTNPRALSAAPRYTSSIDNQGDDLGFRCAKDR
jgi:formylglycine-generating enzyme required for sulfatase activity